MTNKDGIWSFKGNEPGSLPIHKRVDGFTYTNLHDKDETELSEIGFVRAAPKPEDLRGHRTRWTGSIWVREPILATNDMVNDERDFRIERGMTLGVTGHPKRIRMTGRDRDQRNLLGLASGAQLRLGIGDVTTLTNFRDEDNVDHELTPMQIIEMWQRSAGWVSLVYQAAWNLKDLVNYGQSIPEDFFDDQYWPPLEI